MLRMINRQILICLREKTSVFWTLLFPLLLATLFHFAFGGLQGRNAMPEMKAAVVIEDRDESFTEYLESLENSHFQILPMEAAAAEKALKEDQVQGVFYTGADRRMVAVESSVSTGILAQILDFYEKNQAILGQIAAEHPENLENAQSAYMEYGNVVSLVSPGGKSLDYIQNYFFALIAMACFYGSFIALSNTVRIQANASALGARVTAGCVKRGKSIAASLLSSWILSFGNILILVFYLQVVLKDIPITEEEGKLLLVCLAATLCSSALGMLVGTVGTWEENIKNGLLIAVSMVGAFLSDLMISGIKYQIEMHAPFLNRINPGALISDAFYSVIIYDDGERYLKSVGLLVLWGLLMLGAAVVSMRRMRYESI